MSDIDVYKRQILEKLETFNLSDTQDDVKGIAFEEFLGTTFRGELGQFFTPRTVSYTHLRIGSLIESPGFYPNLTATENLRIFAPLRGVPNNHAIKDALDLVGLPYKDKNCLLYTS